MFPVNLLKIVQWVGFSAKSKELDADKMLYVAEGALTVSDGHLLMNFLPSDTDYFDGYTRSIDPSDFGNCDSEDCLPEAIERGKHIVSGEIKDLPLTAVLSRYGDRPSKAQIMVDPHLLLKVCEAAIACESNLVLDVAEKDQALIFATKARRISQSRIDMIAFLMPIEPLNNAKDLSIYFKRLHSMLSAFRDSTPISVNLNLKGKNTGVKQ